MTTNERKIDYLRISLTDRCNLRCRYCMPYAVTSVPMKDILTYEEICKIAEIAAKEGIRHIRVTGGEPLVRKGCTECVCLLKRIPGIETVMMTTNGILLKENLPELVNAGIDGINISLDTLNSEKYKVITGYDGLYKVLESIQACVDAGIRTKINVAAAREINESEILELAQISRDLPVDVRFIEMMPIGYGKEFHGLDNREVLKELRRQYPDINEAEKIADAGYGPAKYFHIPGFLGRTGLISPIHGKFCEGCNRIRLTSTGKLKFCLCYEDGIELRSLIRSGKSTKQIEEELRKIFRETGKRKPKEHHFEKPEKISETKRMNEIGG